MAANQPLCELHKTLKEGDVYYLDEQRTAIVSAFAIVGNCPLLETLSQKIRGHIQDMFLLSHEIHQGLCEIVNNSDILS